MSFHKNYFKRHAFCALLLTSGFASSAAFAQNAPAAAPKFLFDANPVHSVGKIANSHKSVTATAVDGGIDVVIAGSDAGYPGFSIVPLTGDSWDLSPWGHVAAKVTNTGDEKLRVSLRVDNPGDWKNDPWNTETISVNPKETKEIKVFFGYHYDFKPGYALKPENVVQLLFFVGKSSATRSFWIEDILAGGSSGDKPPVNPSSVRERPAKGVIVGPGTAFEYAPKLEAKGGAKAEWSAEKRVVIDLLVGQKGSVTVKPGMGAWNLGESHEVTFYLRNIGSQAVVPSVRVDSAPGSTDIVSAESPLAPGKTATLTASFVAATPWVGDPGPAQKYAGAVPGTGAKFESDRANGVTLILPESQGAVKLELVAAIATATPAVLPNWVGKRPPVEGDWKATLHEEFNGDAINLKVWNIYTANFWDKRTHFTKDNTIITDGKLILRYEKKTGFHNDDPNDTSAVAKTDFACGYAGTYGKWTQRYGYFEARMKLPTCPGLWPAFWTMPDRGGDPDPAVNPQWKRADTKNGGMEFDIMEHLTGWGPYRFNSAFHWDGYGKEHKSVGTSNMYVPADKEGFITIGMLWLPGKVVYYGNGEIIGSWENERVCNIQSYPILYMVSGGWANTPLDQSQLPADFVIDYFRAWQRTDLASPEDGHKPNNGGPKAQF